ncbi:hypothetical protein M3I53_11530 [Paraburkholderia sp. CNPSo 3272]|uniref:glycosyltransferase family 2 protein n=1 Tax=Paraburkholderia sp. CNPSo 3272 TaxID=2940931 RepID=UPI0020B7F2A5|nr:hypothetical protein [Paraburkholderia sp. CNPSo 3272]MCP3723754.1 hypothetical protein [Paraburkholderia sp. CNPSo 3272]
MTPSNPAPISSTPNAALNILIALPTYDNAVHFDFAMALARLMEALKERHIRYEYIHTASSHIIRARNFFANYFLSHREFSHLLFLDTDMDFSREAVLRLLAGDKPVAGIACPYRFFDREQRITSADVGLTLREWQEKTVDYNTAILADEAGSSVVSDGWAEVSHVGTGIFLVRRDALEAIAAHTALYRPPAQYAGYLPDGKFHAFFDTVSEKGVYLSEDLSFCRRVRAAGKSVWALIDEKIVHHGASSISGTYLHALEMRGHMRK